MKRATACVIVDVLPFGDRTTGTTSTTITTVLVFPLRKNHCGEQANTTIIIPGEHSG